jgi:hypothetical protein
LRRRFEDIAMITRTKRVTLTFKYPFSLKGVDRRLAASQYEVASDEELIEELSFQSTVAFRRSYFFCLTARRRSKWSM